MSGHIETTICPNCGNDECEFYVDYNPIVMGMYTCFECGLHIRPEVVYMDLEELNEYREQINDGLDEDEKLPLLEELPSERKTMKDITN